MERWKIGFSKLSPDVDWRTIEFEHEPMGVVVGDSSLYVFTKRRVEGEEDGVGPRAQGEAKGDRLDNCP